MLNMENYELVNVNDLEEEMIMGCANEDIVDMMNLLSDATGESLSRMEEGEEKDKLIDKLEFIKKFPSILDELYFSTPEIYANKEMNADEWEPEDDDYVDIVIKMPMYLVLKGTVRDIMKLSSFIEKCDNEDN